MRSTRLPESPPEFFVDRCLGKNAPGLLRAWGWKVHLITDHYPDDAQNIADDEWMAEGLERGWSLLTQDDRIVRQEAARNQSRVVQPPRLNRTDSSRNGRISTSLAASIAGAARVGMV